MQGYFVTPRYAVSFDYTSFRRVNWLRRYSGSLVYWLLRRVSLTLPPPTPRLRRGAIRPSSDSSMKPSGIALCRPRLENRVFAFLLPLAQRQEQLVERCPATCMLYGLRACCTHGLRACSDQVLGSTYSTHSAYRDAPMCVHTSMQRMRGRLYLMRD